LNLVNYRYKRSKEQFKGFKSGLSALKTRNMYKISVFRRELLERRKEKQEAKEERLFCLFLVCYLLYCVVAVLR